MNVIRGDTGACKAPFSPQGIPIFGFAMSIGRLLDALSGRQISSRAGFSKFHGGSEAAETAVAYKSLDGSERVSDLGSVPSSTASSAGFGPTS